MKQTATILVAMAASAFLPLLAMPPVDQGYLAWFMFVPLLLAVRGIGGAMGFLCGLGTCLLAAAICSSNLLYPAIVAEADNGWVYAGLAIFGLLVGIVAAFFAEMPEISLRKGVALAAFAVCLEWISGVLLPANIAIVEHRSAAMLFIASLGGIWVVSFLVWSANILMVAAFFSRRRVPIFAGVLAVALASVFTPASKPVSGPKIAVAAIQVADPMPDEIAELNRQAGAQGVGLAVWPELAGAIFASHGDTARLVNLASEPGQPAFATSFEDSAEPPHNVAAVFDSRGESAHYQKRRLFGGERAIRRSGGKPASHGVIGLNICFDSCYPSIIRDTARLPGVAVIALPNHDPASPNGFVQACHAAYTPFRAAESGVALVRADSSAFSMIVDQTGRVVAKAGAGTKIITAELSTRPRSTFYKLTGDWFPWVCAAVALAAAARSFLQRRAAQT